MELFTPRVMGHGSADTYRSLSDVVATLGVPGSPAAGPGHATPGQGRAAITAVENVRLPVGEAVTSATLELAAGEYN